MKKAKIFLTAITVFAVVGGALAFKAKTFGQQFCTRIENEKGACEAGYVGQIDVDKGNAFYYTTTDDLSACEDAICNSTTLLTDVEVGN
jgi:hypothetical protein